VAIDDLDYLRSHLPALFDDADLPPDWDDDWLVLPIDEPEATSSMDAEVLGSLTDEPRTPASNRTEFSPALPDFGDLSFPGSPTTRPWLGYAPPPDALAFYLPFHYFYPAWWGIYLLVEGVDWLATLLVARSGGELAEQEAAAVVRIFLFGHEAFHHSTESFATRLEITHRQALYRLGIERHFQQTYGTDDCLEEALASAHGYRKVKEHAFRKPDAPAKRNAALLALAGYLRETPPGYNRALEFLSNAEFTAGRAKLAEEYHFAALPDIPAASPSIWVSFPHAFTGISRVNTRVNYLIRADSPLAARRRLGLRYLRYRDVADRLRSAGCQEIRAGSGSHVIWENPNGRRFPVPRHPGDLRRGTLAKLIKQAGLSMSVTEFNQFAA